MGLGDIPVAASMSDDAVDVLVRVVPRARRDEVGPERDGRLIVRTQAPPVDDQANEAVGQALARHFGVRRRDVELIAGGRARDKTFRVRHLARSARLERLTASAVEPVIASPRAARRPR